MRSWIVPLIVLACIVGGITIITGRALHKLQEQVTLQCDRETGCGH